MQGTKTIDRISIVAESHSTNTALMGDNDSPPVTLQKAIHRAHASPALALGLSSHAAEIAWLEDHGQCWDQAFVADASVALEKGHLGDWLSNCIADRLSAICAEFASAFSKKPTYAEACRFVAQIAIDRKGRLNMSCVEPLSRLLVWCESVAGTLLNVIRLRLEQFSGTPELVRLFDSIAGRDEGLLTIHPNASILLEADRQRPGEALLSPQETGQVLLSACIWPERQGAVGVCAMVSPQLTVYHGDPRLLLTELKSFVERGVVPMVVSNKPLNLEVPCALQLSNEHLEKSSVSLAAVQADPAGQVAILLESWPAMRRALDVLCRRPLDSAAQDVMLRQALVALSADQSFLDTSSQSMMVSVWDLCLAAVANEHHVSMDALKGIMRRPLASQDPGAARLRDCVERTRLGLISCTHSIVSRAWFEVFVSGANAKFISPLCDAIVSELFPSRIGRDWVGAAKAKADLSALLICKCQFLAHEEINGFRLFVRTTAMGARGVCVTTPEQFADCMGALIGEWSAGVLESADGSRPDVKANAVKEVEELVRDPAFASRVNGRLLLAKAFKTPWMTQAGVVSTRHIVVDGIRNLSNEPQRVLSITYTCDLIDQVLEATAFDIDRLRGLSDLERCTARLGVSARRHRFAILYGQPCWEHLRASSMNSHDWLTQHLSVPGKTWSQRPWNQDDLRLAWKPLDQVIPDYDAQGDRKYICDNGGEANPQAFIRLVEALIARKSPTDKERRLEMLSIAIAGARQAPLFIVADLNYEGPHALLCLFYDPRLDGYRYIRSSDRMYPPEFGDPTGMPRACELAVDDIHLYGDEGGTLRVNLW